MPVIRTRDLQRAAFERGMADASATSMERNLHIELAALHAAAADARPHVPRPKESSR